MWAKSKRTSGFTIVELLIVIVVIGILAAVTTVAYSGIQARARDAQRLSDMATIINALEMYKIQTGSYPSPSYNGAYGYEISSINPENFLSVLKTSGVVSKVPVDPVNTGNADIPGSKTYLYYRYPAGYSGCDATKGPFYVLQVQTGESASKAATTPGFSCPSGGSWNTLYWSTGSFTN